MASISGLSSGLDTATIINQLMQLEAAPQARLKSRVTSEQSAVSTLQSLNTRVAALQTKAASLTSPTAWAPLKATSSGAGVSVTTATGAGPATLSVTVTKVARTHQLGFATAGPMDAVVTGASTKVRLDRFDGSPVEIETGDGTLTGLVAAINDPAKETGLRASAVKVADGSYKLMVESVATGAAQDFELTALDGTALLGGSTAVAGSDASLDLGAGVTVTSTSNTFKDVLPGISITVADGTAPGTTSKVTVARDSAQATSSVKDLVASLNAMLSSIDSQSKYDPTTKSGGPLTGNAVARELRAALVDSVYPDDGTSLASIGIQVSRTGQLVVDEAALARAYAADPVGTGPTFAEAVSGFATRLAAVAKKASDPIDGSLTTAITGRRDGISRLQGSITNWDTRLELRRVSLEKQFTSLETALNQMSSQSSWLAGQLGSLPTSS